VSDITVYCIKKQAEVSATAQKGEAAKKTELIKEIQLSKLK
jgi:hypothetical protein